MPMGPLPAVNFVLRGRVIANELVGRACGWIEGLWRILKVEESVWDGKLIQDQS